MLVSTSLIDGSQLPFGLGTIRDAETTPTESTPRRCLNCLSAWERFGTTRRSSTSMTATSLNCLSAWERFGTRGASRHGTSSSHLNCLSAWERFGTESSTTEKTSRRRSQLPFGLGTGTSTSTRTTESQLPFGLGTIRDTTSGGETRTMNVSSQLPFGLGTIRDHLRADEGLEAAVRRLNCLSAWERFGTLCVLARIPHKPRQSQLPFGLGTIRDGGRVRLLRLPRRPVSIAFRLGNDSGRGDLRR